MPQGLVLEDVRTTSTPIAGVSSQGTQDPNSSSSSSINSSTNGGRSSSEDSVTSDMDDGPMVAPSLALLTEVFMSSEGVEVLEEDDR